MHYYYGVQDLVTPMVIVNAIPGSRFSIRHLSAQHVPGNTYTFDNTFLPVHIAQHVTTLLGAGRRNWAVYPLTERQDVAIAEIFDKLCREAGSGYRFSHQLEKTYLIELIHFITRLKG